MRLAVLSDIHSNIEALEAVLGELRRFSPDRIICCGDVVGYGASPSECIALVREAADLVVAGNHDYGAIGMTDTSRFNPTARAAIEWTAQQLDFAEKKWLSSLPIESSIENCKFVHGSPLSPESWHYIRKSISINAQFDSFNEPVCFVGHSHIPGLWGTELNEYCPPREGLMQLYREYRYIIDVGSVGRPRDGEPKAAFVIFDTDDLQLEFVRVGYNIDSAARRIIDAGLPQKLAERLHEGK